VAYLESADVQAWLQHSKFPVTAVAEELDAWAAQQVVGKLAQRYVTSSWLDGSTTPILVKSIMAMLVASAMLRRAISENEGESAYPNWLEKRAYDLCDSIVAGSIDLPTEDVDPDSSLGGGPVFFPTDASTTLWETDPTAEGAAPLYSTMAEKF